MLLSMEIVRGCPMVICKEDGSSSDCTGAIIPNGNKGPSGPILKNVCPLRLKSKQQQLSAIRLVFFKPGLDLDLC